jgi:type I restriction enzyme S subunit
MRFPDIAIGDLVEKGATWDPRKNENGFFEYIDLSSVDKDVKKITVVVRFSYKDAPSRARQLVKKNDVLVATVRPNLNGVALVTDAFDGMTASTGYCVLRPRPQELDSRYLFHWVKTQTFVQRMVELATGANYPAVSDAKVKASTIPLPPLAEQKRIAGILDAADALRAKRRESIAQLDALLQSTFLEMFGDPVTNPKGWDVHPLSHFVSRLDGGKNVAQSETPTKYRVLKVSAVTSGVYRPDESKFLPIDFKVRDAYLVKQGDLLISRANTSELIGATAYVWETPNHIVLPDKIWKFIWKTAPSVEPLFVYYLSRHPRFRRLLGDRASGTSGSMKNIAKPKLLSLPIILPPIELQSRFAHCVTAVEQIKSRSLEHSSELDSLFSSLQHHAFSGEL